MPNWSRKFHKPLYVRGRTKPITTLREAVAFMEKLGDQTLRNEWQFAAAKLLECQDSGSCFAARDALKNALFLNAMLDVNQE